MQSDEVPSSSSHRKNGCPDSSQFSRRYDPGMSTRATVIASAWFDSPLGPIRLDASERGLCRLELRAAVVERGSSIDARRRNRSDAVLEAALGELSEFFAGRPRTTQVALDLAAGTAFERAVWSVLARSVGPGALVTYGELALRCDRPGAARAVGRAMGRNPIPILVPCHRVVAAGARPGGFGLGLAVKHALLACEGSGLPGYRDA